MVHYEPHDGPPHLDRSFLPSFRAGAPVAQTVKRWSADLVVPGSRLAGGGNLSNRKRGSVTHSLLSSQPHHADMEKGVKSQIVYPSIIFALLYFKNSQNDIALAWVSWKKHFFNFADVNFVICFLLFFFHCCFLSLVLILYLHFKG